VYRERLPQLDGGVFLTDGGIETTLIFHHGLELPLFAAFDLLKDEEGTEQLRLYYAPYAIAARDRGVGLVLESPTWRASLGWAAKLGYSDEELDALNRKAIALMEELRGRPPPERPSARRRDPAGGRRNGRRPRLLHDQLRPSEALRRRDRRRGAVGATARRPAHERVDEVARGA
jgi:hypothetical protein